MHCGALAYAMLYLSQDNALTWLGQSIVFALTILCLAGINILSNLFTFIFDVFQKA